jgi:hypothetical protein
LFRYNTICCKRFHKLTCLTVFHCTELKYPNLHFSNGVKIEGAPGSWTRERQFEHPAEINSFAVVNCVDRQNENGAADFIKNVSIFLPDSDRCYLSVNLLNMDNLALHFSLRCQLFRVCIRHGLSVPPQPFVEPVTARHLIEAAAAGPDRHALNQAIASSITNAKRAFLFDERKYFKNRQMFFQTFLRFDGRLYSCMIDPHFTDLQSNEVVVFLENRAGKFPDPMEMEEPWQPTHIINYRGQHRYARLKYKGDGRIIDLFDLKDKGDEYYAIIDGKRETFQSIELVFQSTYS